MKNAKVLKSKVLSQILEIFIIIAMVSAVVIMILLPFTLKDVIHYMGRGEIYDKQGNYIFLIVCLYPAIISGTMILEQLRKIFRKVKHGTPFCNTVSKGLNHICMYSSAIAAITLIKFIVIPGIITFFIIAAFLVAALSAFVLAEVFERAIEIKNENDLTI